mgnify:CR=1 FL=1
MMVSKDWQLPQTADHSTATAPQVLHAQVLSGSAWGAFSSHCLDKSSLRISSFSSLDIKRQHKTVALLSMIDSSIGGKSGVNLTGGKNLIGSFMQPDIVISDINFLKSLPKREIICGYGCLLYTSPSPRDQRGSRMPSSA